jgi:hypothetical protein
VTLNALSPAQKADRRLIALSTAAAPPGAACLSASEGMDDLRGMSKVSQEFDTTKEIAVRLFYLMIHCSILQNVRGKSNGNFKSVNQ